MEEIREAMAEAIQDMEMEAGQQEIREESGSGRRVESIDREISTARPTTIPASSAEGQAPLQLM
jgi:hypothetical protein